MVVKIMFCFAVLLSVVRAQDSVSVRVFGSASSENVVKIGDAVATAIANIEKACVIGDDVNLVARSEARKVVEAAATATAQGGIYIESKGAGQGAGSTKASAKSTAEAIANAIATAIGSVAGGPKVQAATSAITRAKESVEVAIEQSAAVKGQGNALAVAAASATAFVSAVADALAAAAAKCQGGVGTVDAAVQTATQELPTFTDFSSTFTTAAANIFGDGFATVTKNQAEAKSDGNTIPPSAPAPPSSIKPASSFVNNILKQLDLL